ncbi:PAS domain-containing protein [Desulfoscipio gibsoniae DSM 7213]|uniref:PAS domain-containing protein n=1 Tax=Desulfoscipio gibsoniae DSM 7213 TaxID=767817 RepID=R4KBS9_9FIRM|nr:PAS domain-containing protein [Desulfoscipio gibsoniae]AGL00643.1 PAS domain-containing protein [Desulfoscipio gibsoniae DSM 7213]
MNSDWVKDFPAVVTLCDTNGKIIEMNDAAADHFRKNGGRELIGRSVFDCHPEPARSKLKTMLHNGVKNCYTIEKNGMKKLIYQTPWYKKNGEYAGFVEMIIAIPSDAPHYIRG